MTPERQQLVAGLASHFADRGIRALALRGPDLGTATEPEGLRRGHGHGHKNDHEIVLLVRPSDAGSAGEILRGTNWRFRVGDRGAWRLYRTVGFLYDDRLGIDLMWGVPGAPLPFRHLGSLERALWEGARSGWNGFLEPEPEALLVFLATQGTRLYIRGRNRYGSWIEDLASCAGQVQDWRKAWDIALAAGVEGSLRRGLDIAGVASPIEASSTQRYVERTEWYGAELLIQHGWPRRVRGYVAAAPRLGTITSEVRFGGVELEVGRGVFVPRGLAETIAEEAIRVLRQRPGAVVDVGTGCGPIPLALASAIPGAEIHATEISRRALYWAERNRRRLGVSGVHFHRGSLLAPLPSTLRGRVRVLTANVPYVPLDEWQDGWRGRESQVVGTDADGLGLYRRLVRQAKAFLTPDGLMIVQLGARYWGAFREELEVLGYRPGATLRQWGTDLAVSVETA